MNIKVANEIHSHVGRMAAAAARFNALYEKNRLCDKSPAEAWELYRQFMGEQAQVANLLNEAALEKPYIRFERWWECRDVISIALVNELASIALRLLEHIAYLEATGKNPENEHSVMSLQESMAGLLHPITRQSGVVHFDGGYQEAV